MFANVKILPVVLVAISSVYSNSPALILDLVLHWKQPIQLRVETCWTPRELNAFMEIASRSSGIHLYTQKANDENLAHRSVVVWDLYCHDLKDIVEHDFSQTRYILFSDKPYSTFDDRPVRNIIEVFNTTNIRDITYAERDKGNGKYLIKKIYKKLPSNRFVEKLIGFWQENKLIYLPLEVDRIKNPNLQGTKLKAAIICNSEDNTETTVNIALTDSLVRLLNATVSYHCVEDWDNGIRRGLENGTFDLGASPSYITAQRLKQIQFLTMTAPLNYEFIFRSPKLSYTGNVFYLSFHKHVWLSTIGIMLLASFLQLLINHVDDMIAPRQGSDEEANYLNGISGALLNMVSIAAQQEALAQLKSISSRSLNIIMLISLMALYICFSANIVVLIQSPSRDIRTLEDLLHSGLQLAAQDSAINHIFMSTQTDPVRKAMYTKIKESKLFLPVAEASERIRAGLFAFHADTNLVFRYMLEHFQEEEKCNLQTIRYLQPLDGYFSMGKKSPYLEHVKVGLLKLQEFGFQVRAIAAHYLATPPCIGDSVFDPVSIIDALFAIQLMACSLFLAAAILGLERITDRFHLQRLLLTKLDRVITAATQYLIQLRSKFKTLSMIYK
ncbi:ionotropic receptor 75a-like [Wyeomyia smithii]|uniref:ionotropic receptor 75a-like n=1 Tax=Wyeomyia smithii TaxID=174621 RepID=UPI0024680C89|nr:ionotropic receptor 75a-like [Wyeomyia smithii]